jgi:hypothetical protein
MSEQESSNERSIREQSALELMETHAKALEAENSRLRAFVTKLANPDFSHVSSPLGPLHAAGMCTEAEIVAKLAKQVLAGSPSETEPPR